jgi:hypothetical protein
MSFRASGEGVHVDLTEWAWVIRLYLDDLDEVLGAPQQLPDDPLEALEALEATLDVPAERPADPVRARLLPDAVLDDPQASGEFRRLTETALLERKRADAAALRGVLSGPTIVDDAVARQLLGALNDLRLMLGTRLSVTEGGVLAGAEALQSYATYQLLTLLQGDLIEVLSEDSP